MGLLLWLSASFSNRRAFFRLLCEPGVDPRFLHLWIEYCYWRCSWSELFELYSASARPYDAAIMMVEAAHAKQDPAQRVQALRVILPFLLQHKLDWLHRQLKLEMELLRRQLELRQHHLHQRAQSPAFFNDFPVPPALESCALTAYHTLIYLWTYHPSEESSSSSSSASIFKSASASGNARDDFLPVEFEKHFNVHPQRKAIAKIRARARLHDWPAVKKIADQSVSTSNRLLSALSLGSSRVVSPANMDFFVAEVFAHRGPVELMVYFAASIPDQRRRFDVALRYRLWDVAIASVQTVEQAMLVLSRLSKNADQNQLWIQKIVQVLKKQN